GARLLSPLPTTMGTYMRLWGKLGDADFDLPGWQAMFRWVNEEVPFPSAAYRQWITEFYQDNKLARGRLHIAGRPVRLAHIRCPLLNVAAAEDEIAPRSTTSAIMRLTSSVDAQEIILKGGQVGVAAYADFVAQSTQIWTNAALQMWGVAAKDPPPPTISPEPGDRRFNAPDWQRNAAFDALKQSYLLGATALLKSAAEVEGLDRA